MSVCDKPLFLAHTIMTHLEPMSLTINLKQVKATIHDGYAIIGNEYVLVVYNWKTARYNHSITCGSICTLSNTGFTTEMILNVRFTNSCSLVGIFPIAKFKEIEANAIKNGLKVIDQFKHKSRENGGLYVNMQYGANAKIDVDTIRNFKGSIDLISGTEIVLSSCKSVNPVTIICLRNANVNLKKCTLYSNLIIFNGIDKPDSCPDFYISSSFLFEGRYELNSNCATTAYIDHCILRGVSLIQYPQKIDKGHTCSCYLTNVISQQQCILIKSTKQSFALTNLQPKGNIIMADELYDTAKYDANSVLLRIEQQAKQESDERKQRQAMSIAIMKPKEDEDTTVFDPLNILK